MLFQISDMDRKIEIIIKPSVSLNCTPKKYFSLIRWYDRAVELTSYQFDKRILMVISITNGLRVDTKDYPRIDYIVSSDHFVNPLDLPY